MKRFQFRLARVLSLKETQENQARLELAESIRRIRESEESERVLRRRVLESRKLIDEELGTPGRVEQLSAHISVQEREIERNLEHRRKLEREREQREERYWEARKERRMLESLRDRKKAAYMKEVAAKESTQYDAFVQFLHMERRRDEDKD